MKKTIYIIRHGDKVRIPGDPSLSDLGNAQAQLSAKYFQSLPITKVIASPILRTQQTAKHIADALGLDYEINEKLKERVNWGDDPNQSFEDFLNMWNRAAKERDWKPPVGDSSRKAGERLESMVKNSLKLNDEHIVLVTHGGIITDFLRNVFSAEELNRHINDFESKLEDNIKECSITILGTNSNDPTLKLISLAKIDHLNQLKISE